MIHDNGGRPFKVIANRNGISVYTYDRKLIDENNYCGECKLSDKEFQKAYTKLLLTFKKFLGYWSGFDSCKDTRFHGNSILVQETKTTYIEIGESIRRFEAPEEILDYISPVGNSDVPYPVAYSENYVYFMLDMVYIGRDQLKTNAIPTNAEDMYMEFYGHIFEKNNKNLKKSS